MLFTRKLHSRNEPTREPAKVDDRTAAPAHAPLPPTGAVAALSTTETATLATPRAAAAGEPTQSVIDASLSIVGDLHSAGDLRVDGRICGNVCCAQLILGRDAVITGSVIAEQAIVRGRLIGTIRAPIVIIQGSAHVECEITYGSLCIDDGAYFEGVVHRRDNPLEEPAALQPATPAAVAPEETSKPAEAEPATTAKPAEAIAAGETTAGEAAVSADTEAADKPTDSTVQPPAPVVANGKAKPSRHMPQTNGHSPVG